MQYFFYGTLCDPEVRRLVLGYRPSPRQIRPATLAGFRRKRAAGRCYPVLIRAPAGRVDGQLFLSARPADAARLAAYEGSEYRTRRLPVQPRHSGCPRPGRRVLVFLPTRGAAEASHADWRLDDWYRRDRAAFLLSLQQQGSDPCDLP